jgi:predicted phosphate transport protein (TIGR00153 family)
MAGGYLSGIFGKSPVQPLQKHMNLIVKCAEELVSFTRAVIEGDGPRVQGCHENIIKLENEADALKKDLRLHLPTSLFMPVDRRDVLEVLTMQDKVAGACRNVAGIIAGRKMVLPREIQEPYLQFVETCVSAVSQASVAISELDELVETGFDKSERKLVNKTLAKLDRIENLTDEQASVLYRTLFSIEDEWPPVQVVFLYSVLDKTGSIADRAQRVGSRLQLMLAR